MSKRRNDFDANPELEYEITLARTLGRTVDELRRTMSQAEFLAQYVYDGRRRQERELAEKMTRG